MKEVRCIETGGYKLTITDTYNVLREDGNYYHLINDSNKQVRYHKRLFEEVEEEVTPVPVQRTEQDMIDSIEHHGTTLTFTDLEGNEVELQSGFEDDDTTISCGILQVQGIDDTVNIINDNIPADDDYIELRKAIFRTFIQEEVIEISNKALVVMSTAIADYDEDMLSVLDEMSIQQTEPVMNPNSGNMIKMWTFRTNSN